MDRKSGSEKYKTIHALLEDLKTREEEEEEQQQQQQREETNVKRCI